MHQFAIDQAKDLGEEAFTDALRGKGLTRRAVVDCTVTAINSADTISGLGDHGADLTEADAQLPVSDVLGVGSDASQCWSAARQARTTQQVGRDGVADLGAALERGLSEGSSLSTVAKRLRWRAQGRQVFGTLLQYATR